MPPRAKKGFFEDPDFWKKIGGLLLAAAVGSGSGGVVGSKTASDEVDAMAQSQSALKERIILLEQAQSRTFEPQVATLTSSVNSLNASIAKLNEQLTANAELTREQVGSIRRDVDSLLGRGRNRSAQPAVPAD